MERRRIIALAAFVVGTGVVVALQFRKQNAATTQSTDTATGHKATASSSSGSWPQPPAPPSDTSVKGQTETTSSAAGQSDTHRALAELDERVFATNRTPREAPPATPTVPVPGDSSTASVVGDRYTVGDRYATVDAEAANAPGANASPAPSGELIDLNGPRRTHRIADGDTLPRLAQRYLGQADRHLELYQHNRDVLRHPDVLPIGAELRIPPRVPIQPSPDEADENAAATENAPSLPPLPPPAAPTAQAKAQPATRTAPRTYQVQRGDNLVDIARKLYGDGRRHEQLFEANRKVLKHPAALKPGMVLVVP